MEQPRGSTALVVAIVVLVVVAGTAAWYFLAKSPAYNGNANAYNANGTANNANTANANEDVGLGVTPAPTMVNSSSDLTNAEAALNVNLDASSESDTSELNGLTNGF